MIWGKKGLAMEGTSPPITYDFLVDSARATLLGRYWSSSMAERTRWRKRSLTGLESLMTAETVATETPALAATSLIVVRTLTPYPEPRIHNYVFITPSFLDALPQGPNQRRKDRAIYFFRNYGGI